MNSIDALPNWNALTAKQRLLILRQEKVRRVSTRRFDLFYPDTGPVLPTRFADMKQRSR